MAQKSKYSKPKALNKSALVAALVVSALFSAAGARQIVSATNQQLDTVQRDLEATSALSARAPVLKIIYWLALTREKALTRVTQTLRRWATKAISLVGAVTH